MAENSKQPSGMDNENSFWNQRDSIASMHDSMMRRMDNLQREFDRLYSSTIFGDFFNTPRRFFSGNNMLLGGSSGGPADNVNNPATQQSRNADLSLSNRDTSFFSDIYRPRSFLSDFFNRRGNDMNIIPSNFSSPSCIPRMDMTDEDNHYLLQADMPGMNKENVKVNVKNGMLNITGHKKEGKREEGKDYVMQERCSSKFFRSVQLPNNIKADDIKANFKDNGTLSITIPKDESGQQRSKHSINIE